MLTGKKWLTFTNMTGQLNRTDMFIDVDVGTGRLRSLNILRRLKSDFSNIFTKQAILRSAKNNIGIAVSIKGVYSYWFEERVEDKFEEKIKLPEIKTF